jgi:hypothetical protein
VHALNQVDGIEQIRFPRSGRSTANINTSHRTPAANDDGTASERLKIVGVTHLKTRNVGEATASDAGPS